MLQLLRGGKMRIGIIGLGQIANRFAKVLHDNYPESCYACAARSYEKAIKFKEQYQFQVAHQTYDELIKDPNVDAIYIALTHNFHYEITKKCILSKKAVLCEKPFFLHEEEAIEIFTLAKKHHVLVMEAMWTRFVPTTKEVTELVQEGKIGTLKYIQVDFCKWVSYDENSRLFNKELAGGALYDIGVYPIDFILGVTKQKPTSISYNINYYPNGTDKTTNLIMNFNDVIGYANTSFDYDLPTNAYLVGSKGSIIVHDFLCSRRVEIFDENNERIKIITLEVEDGFIYQIEHFMNLYQKGEKESPLMTYDDTTYAAHLFDVILGGKKFANS